MSPLVDTALREARQLVVHRLAVLDCMRVMAPHYTSPETEMLTTLLGKLDAALKEKPSPENDEYERGYQHGLADARMEKTS